jgi:alkylation response protein AidB-like acyl-CoA dehydrogenase
MMSSLIMFAYTRGIWWERRTAAFIKSSTSLITRGVAWNGSWAIIPLLDAIIQFAKENNLSKEPVIRNKLAQLQIEFEVGRLLIYRVALVMEEGRAPNWESAMSKAYSTEFEKHLAGVAMEVLGPYGQLKSGSKFVPSAGHGLTFILGL